MTDDDEPTEPILGAQHVWKGARRDESDQS